MKLQIIKIALCAFLFCSAQLASADIKEFFQKGEQVAIGDSIKGRMMKFSTDGELYAVNSESAVLPSECRIVLQENDTVWMENMFPIQSEKDYHIWLKGIYIKDAKFINTQTDKEEVHDIFALLPYVNVDFMEWTEDDKKYTCKLMLNRIREVDPPQIYFVREYRYPNAEEKMDSYIKFIIGDDMSIHALGSFGEEMKNYTTYWNYNVTCPYGIDLNKLFHKISKTYNGGLTSISNLKLTPILPSGK